MIDRLLGPSLLHSHADQRCVDIARRVVFGFWALMAFFEPLVELAELPVELVSRVGPLHLMNDAALAGFWSATGLGCVKWAVVGFCVACFASRTMLRYAGVPAFASILTYQLVVRAYGHVNHGELAMMISAGLLALFALLPSKRPDERDGHNPFAGVMVAICLTILVPYSLIGVSRVAAEAKRVVTGNGERVFFTEAMVSYCVSRSSMEGLYEKVPKVGHFMATSPAAEWVLNVGFVVVTTFEVLAPLCLVSRWYRAAFLVTMAGFHVGSLFMMHIFFWENLVLYGLFLNFSRQALESPGSEATSQ